MHRRHLRQQPPFALPTQGAPAPAPRSLHRAHLVERLPRPGAGQGINLTAPSGYGKTELLDQWLATYPCRAAWVDLVPAHDDPATLTTTLQGAIDQAAEQSSEGEAMAIVLEGVHHLGDPAVHAELATLVRLSPPQLTVVLTSRQRLPFPTARLTAYDDAVHLGAHDLALRPEELRLLADGFGCPWPGDRAERVVTWLHRATDGWPEPAIDVLTRLAASGWDPSATVRLRVDQPFTDRVLGDVPEDLVQFLVDTAHLDDLDPKVCAAVTGRSDALAALDALCARHLLLTWDDGQFRRNDVLTLALRQREDATLDRPLAARHLRAAERYTEVQRHDLAFDQAVAASHPVLIVATLGPALAQAMEARNAEAIERWAATVPLDSYVPNDAATVARLSAGFLPIGRRGRWTTSTDRTGVGALTVRSVDLARAGRCTEARLVAAQARHQRRVERLADPALVEGILTLVEGECRLLEVGAQATTLDIERSLLTHPWAVLRDWAVGQQALQSVVAGDLGRATALLAHAKAHGPDPHPSWLPLAPVHALVAEALTTVVTEGSVDPQLVAVLERLVALPRAAALGPLDVLVRFTAAALVSDPDQADRWRREGEEAARALPPLALLTEVRDLVAGDTTGVIPPSLAALTPPEHQVLRLLATDLTMAEIAAELNVSIHTVKARASAIYRKLGVNRRAEAVAELPTTYW